MEPRNESPNKTPEQPKAATKSRFQIEKLEERIAPRGRVGPCRGSCAHYAPGRYR
jgi:hypothetical protein